MRVEVRMDLKQADEIINKVYQELLGRSPDKQGRWGKIQSLMGGRSEEDIRKSIMQSKEYKDRHGNLTDINNILRDYRLEYYISNPNEYINLLKSKKYRDMLSGITENNKDFDTVCIMTLGRFGDILAGALPTAKWYHRKGKRVILVVSEIYKDFYNNNGNKIYYIDEIVYIPKVVKNGKIDEGDSFWGKGIIDGLSILSKKYKHACLVTPSISPWYIDEFYKSNMGYLQFVMMISGIDITKEENFSKEIVLPDLTDFIDNKLISEIKIDNNNINIGLILLGVSTPVTLKPGYIDRLSEILVSHKNVKLWNLSIEKTENKNIDNSTSEKFVKMPTIISNMDFIISVPTGLHEIAIGLGIPNIYILPQKDSRIYENYPERTGMACQKIDKLVDTQDYWYSQNSPPEELAKIVTDKINSAMTGDVKPERPATEINSQSKIETNRSPSPMPRGIFINPTEAKCSIYESGRMMYKALLLSDKYELDYIEVDKNKRSIPDTYDFYIFNYHHTTMGWLDTKCVRLLPGIKITFVLEVVPNNPFVLCPSEDFDAYCVLDPTMNIEVCLSMKKRTVYAFPRPLELPIKSTQYQEPTVPVIGSFGFATHGKGFERVVDAVNKEFDEAIIRINIPVGTYTLNNIAGDIEELCKKTAKKGIQVVFTQNFMSKEELIEWCGQNTLNCFLYDRNMPGLAATTDQAISSGRPLAVSENVTFRHIIEYIKPYPHRTLKESIEVSQSEVLRMQKNWAPANFAKRFEQVLADYNIYHNVKTKQNDVKMIELKCK